MIFHNICEIFLGFNNDASSYNLVFKNNQIRVKRVQTIEIDNSNLFKSTFIFLPMKFSLQDFFRKKCIC